MSQLRSCFISTSGSDAQGANFSVGKLWCW
jgi:hypothetical protein